MTWILMEEGLTPEPRSKVLVTMSNSPYRDSTNAWTQEAYFDSDRMFYDPQDNLIHSRVIAWMYMPKPYPEQP